MSIKNILLEKLMGVSHPMKLKYPYNEDIDSFIYTSEKDEYGYSSWRFVEKKEVHDLQELSRLINQEIHPNLLEYCNSYWFLSFEGDYCETTAMLLPVIPSKKGFYFEYTMAQFYGEVQQALSNCLEYTIDFKEGLLYLGMLDDYMYVYFSNTTGEIYTYDFDLNVFTRLKESLKSFIECI